jgi:FtsH ternary system-associated peptide
VHDAVPAVAASEYELVLLARGLIEANASEVCATLYRTRALPPAISTTCARLLGDTLAHAWPALWRRGAIQPGASIEGRGEGRGEATGGAVRRGRIWERHAPVGLGFSVATLRLLRWLLATPLAAPRSILAPLAAGPLTIGDQVMVYLALDAAAGTPAQAAIAAQPLVRAAPLAWLGFADRLGEGDPGELASLCHGAGAIVVEALTSELARRWRMVELGKRAIEAPDTLIALGAAQDATLGGFLAACDRHHRRDLAGFVLDAAAPLVARGISPMPARLDPDATLARRAAARVAAGALLRGVMTWARWDEAHRGVRFIDDDYAMAQLLLARFEAIQPAGAARTAAWLADLAGLAPLAPTTVPASAATVNPP